MWPRGSHDAPSSSDTSTPELSGGASGGRQPTGTVRVSRQKGSRRTPAPVRMGGLAITCVVQIPEEAQRSFFLDSALS